MFTNKKQLTHQVKQLKQANDIKQGTIEELKERIKQRDLSFESMAKERAELDKANTTLKSAANALTEQLNEQRAVVRKQTEADLLLNALQAVGIVPAPVPKVDHFERGKELQASLNQYYAAAQRAALSPASLGDSLFGAGFLGR